MAFGLGSYLASAMRKVVDALPDGHRVSLDDAAQRLLIEPETDLLSRRLATEDIAGEVMDAVRQTLITGHKLRFRYTPPDKAPRRHVVDPIGLVTVRGRTYLLATKAGESRTYRLSRMSTAEALPEAADRPAEVDLDQMWAERTADFLAEYHISVTVRVKAARKEDLLGTARAVRAEWPEDDDWVRLEVTFEDLRHAVWAIWQLDTAAEAVAPDELRAALCERAETLAGRYRSAR